MAARITLILGLLFSPLFCFAQPLADKVPANALVYVGWQGSESMPPGFQQSRLKAILDNSNIPAAINDFLPKLMDKIGEKDPQAAPVVKLVSTIGEAAWKHPTAIWIGPMDIAGAGQGPVPHAAVICQAGADADALLQQFQALAGQAQGAPFPIKAFKEDGIVGLEAGYDQPAQALASGAATAISGNDNFKKAMTQVQKEAVGILYVDGEGVLAQIDQVVNVVPDQQAKQMWPVIKESLGLGGLKRIVATCGLDGRDWGSQLFIAAPAPRKGLLAMADAQPISDDALRTVPKTATLMSAGRLDLAKLVSQIRETAGKIDPQAQAGFDMVMGMARQQIGMDVQKDLLTPLGDEWVLYADPNSTGSGLLGFVLVNKLRQAEAAQASLTKLEGFINETMKRETRGEVTVQFQTTQASGATIHYLAIPFVAPAWAIKNGNMYVGVYPQMVAAALNNGGAGKSILDNADFVALRDRLGGAKASSISFADLPKSAGGGYQLMLLLSQMGLGFGDLFGVKAPAMVIPPLGKIREQLAPAGGVFWTDDEGLHFRHITPFPGAELFASPLAGMDASMAAMGASVMLPAMFSARERAQRVQGASNLRQIGVGVMLFASDNKGKYPADLGTLAKSADLSPMVFISAKSGKQVPGNVLAAGGDEAAKWVNQNADYVYLGAKMKQADSAEMVLAYEKPELNNGQGMNVLFNDGHVEWMSVPVAMEQIQKQQEAK